MGLHLVSCRHEGFLECCSADDQMLYSQLCSRCCSCTCSCGRSRGRGRSRGCCCTCSCGCGCGGSGCGLRVRMNPRVCVGAGRHGRRRRENALTVQADDQGEGYEGREGAAEVVPEGVVGMVCDEGGGGDDGVVGKGGVERGRVGCAGFVAEGLRVVCCAGVMTVGRVAAGVAAATVIVVAILASGIVAIAA